jgi:hypothetical protein
MQFSIRDMMIVTFAVGCLLALAALQCGFDFDEWLVLTIITVPFATVGLVAAWGVLGTKRPFISVVVLFAVAVGAGYSVEKMLGPGQGFDNWMTATVTKAISLAVSLLLVRSWGYRLRRASRQPASHPTRIKNRV